MNRPEYRWDVTAPVNTLRKAILEAVCEEFECNPDQLRGGVRKRHLTDARGAYSFLCRAMLADTYNRISIELNKNHAAIINQVRRIEDYLTIRDKGICQRMKRIENKLLHLKPQITL